MSNTEHYIEMIIPGVWAAADILDSPVNWARVLHHIDREQEIVIDRDPNDDELLDELQFLWFIARHRLHLAE